MCIEVIYRDKEISCQKEFVGTFGAENLIFRDASEKFEPEVCLCPVDLDAVAEKLNLFKSLDESCMFVIFTDMSKEVSRSIESEKEEC